MKSIDMLLKVLIASESHWWLLLVWCAFDDDAGTDVALAVVSAVLELLWTGRHAILGLLQSQVERCESAHRVPHRRLSQVRLAELVLELLLLVDVALRHH